MKKSLLFLLLIPIMITCIAIPLGSTASANTTEYSARSYYVVDYSSGEVILAKDEDKRYPIASMVKIMTLLLTYENINNGNLKLDEKIEISADASSMGGSQMFLDAGSSYMVKDLVTGVVVASANDAAYALGERISGNIDSFIALMNEKAKSIGMNDTLFCNVTGLPDEKEQYSTAKDVTKMMKVLLKNEEYYNHSNIWLKDFTHEDGRTTTLTNTNKLIRFYNKCDGGKTGFTNKAMFCLSATAKVKDMRVIATVLGEPDSKTRFRDVTKMFNYAFANYENKILIEKQQPIVSKLDIKGAKDVPYELYCDENVGYFTKKGQKRDVDFVINIDKNLKAPIKKGSVVGEIVVKENGNSIYSVDIKTLKDIEKQTYFDALIKTLDNWFI